MTEAAGWKVLATIATLSAESFAERFLAGYAMGSLARGGFAPLVSDVDFGLLLESPLIEEDVVRIAELARQMQDSGLPLSERLSIFWGSPASLSGAEPGGRFPPFDKLDLLEHALLIKGEDARAGIPRPSRRELEVDGMIFALDYLGAAEKLPEYRDPNLLLQKGALDVSKTVLYPVRFLYTLQTGGVAGNDVAVEKYSSENTGPDADLVKAAYAWRQGEEVAPVIAKKLLSEGLIALYLKYLCIYLQRMRDYDETTLARRVELWIEQLMG